jgi:hypothetical protein
MYQIQKSKADAAEVADNASSRAYMRNKASEHSKRLQGVIQKYNEVLETNMAERSSKLTVEMVVGRTDGHFPWSYRQAEAFTGAGAGRAEPLTVYVSSVLLLLLLFIWMSSIRCISSRQLDSESPAQPCPSLPLRLPHGLDRSFRWKNNSCALDAVFTAAALALKPRLLDAQLGRTDVGKVVANMRTACFSGHHVGKDNLGGFQSALIGAVEAVSSSW